MIYKLGARSTLLLKFSSLHQLDNLQREVNCKFKDTTKRFFLSSSWQLPTHFTCSMETYDHITCFLISNFQSIFFCSSTLVKLMTNKVHRTKWPLRDYKLTLPSLKSPELKISCTQSGTWDQWTTGMVQSGTWDWWTTGMVQSGTWD